VKNIYTAAAKQTTAGLQKWVFNGTTWTQAYVLTAGLNLGVPYTVGGYPTGNNSVTDLPWSPATVEVMPQIVTVPSPFTRPVMLRRPSVSGNGDQGADPNKLVMITDTLASTAPAT
jgi:hypothetical protein